jgi:hypothetical protein
VGINDFKNYPGAALRGCVNDVNNMEALLQKWLGFTPGDIVKLTDAQATKANIMQHLKEMVDGAKQGKYSYLVFSLSSHGTQVPDVSEDEESDLADEAVCPHDLAEAGDVWDPNYIIIDDELRDLFIQLPANVLLEVYLDTCHSGDGLRAVDLLPGRKPRWMPPPSFAAFKKLEGRRSRGLDKALFEQGIVHHILWAACRADQTAADAFIAGDYHGAFTYHFCKVMHETQNKLSRKKVLYKVRGALAGEYTQVPQLEAEATKRDNPIA